MKIQLALDRISIEKAIEIGEKAYNYVDIIEVGTSLIKDYGIKSIKEIKKVFLNKFVLADLKTIDEGEYEFNAAYNAGADIATVMGVAPFNTISICYEVSQRNKKTVMIDLMETEENCIKKLKQFRNAIFCIHIAKDEINKNLDKYLIKLEPIISGIPRIAVAGGVDLNILKKIHTIEPEIVIVGSAITKADDIEQASREFYYAVRSLENNNLKNKL